MNLSSSTKSFEDELSSDLEKDDAEVLERRYKSYRKGIRQVENKLLNQKLASKAAGGVGDSTPFAIPKPRQYHTRTQWTRALDAVQEHFSSHVTIDGTSHKLPPTIYALKLAAKHSWLLYKKRECERRKRIRKKLEAEKEKEIEKKEPSNILLSMVDMCEICKRLYITVNLFWGVTICDSCYFNPSIINEIMKKRCTIAESKVEITPENVVEEITKRYGLPPMAVSSSSTPPPPPPPSPILSSEEEESNDFRPFSTYSSSSSSNLPPPPTSPNLSPDNPIERYEALEDAITDSFLQTPDDGLDYSPYHFNFSQSGFGGFSQQTNSALFYTLNPKT